MSFAEDYEEYQRWALAQETSPAAWERHKALVVAAKSASNPDIPLALDLLDDVEAHIHQDTDDAYFGSIIRAIYVEEFGIREDRRKEVEPE